MTNEMQHQMVMKNTYPTGVQEYYCPICGRHIMLQWPPDYKRIILNDGDPDALHTGSGGVDAGSAGPAMEQFPADAYPDAENGGEAPGGFDSGGADNNGGAENIGGGENIGGAENDSAASGDPGSIDDAYLEPWVRWLSDRGI